MMQELYRTKLGVLSKFLYLLIFFILVISVYFIKLNFLNEETIEKTPKQNLEQPTDQTSKKSTSSQVIVENPVTPQKYTARFEIFTNGTKRIFTSAMYHNKSADVYIENPDPSIIMLNKPNITWNDFFKTLPFTLNQDCLITGTKQTFCNNETKKLHFYINQQETSDALDRVINPNDFLRVEYKTID